MKQPIFKKYNQNQTMLFPEAISDLIPENHIVRVLDEIIQKMDLSKIYSLYPGGGASAYDPEMMLKILIYGYIDNVRTVRKLEKALHENVNYMWLSGRQTPDFHTLNNFRRKLISFIKDIFSQVVDQAESLGMIKFERLFVDGTKIEANGNRHKMVWKKNAKKFKERRTEQIDELFNEIERLNDEEDALYGDENLPEFGREGLLRSPEAKAAIEKAARQASEKINERIKKTKRKIDKLESQKKNYEMQEQTCGERSGYSKTDIDATAMRMKDGSTRPAYNVMTACENQIVLNFEVEQNCSDSGLFTKLMDGIKDQHQKLPGNVCGDQAFGTEENYDYCKRQEMNSFLKFPSFHREQTAKFKSNSFLKENFTYDKLRDVYICPENQELIFVGLKEKKTRNGYHQVLREYKCFNCAGCPSKEACTKAANRTIDWNEKLEKHKAVARILLKSDEGKEICRKRGSEVETPYANVKENQMFRKFRLRGLIKTTLEAGLIFMAHNIKKIASLHKEKLKEFVENVHGLAKSNQNTLKAA